MKIRPAILADSSAIAKIQVDSYQAENRIGQVVGYGLGGKKLQVRIFAGVAG